MRDCPGGFSLKIRRAFKGIVGSELMQYEKSREVKSDMKGLGLVE